MKKFSLFDIFKRQQSINKMKLSIHLFYGIIIGILLVACTGSFKEDKAEFKEEKIEFLGISDEKIKEIKAEGWTIIDYEINGRSGSHYALIGR